ncbi:glutamate ABC transporter substrate-binding protein [Frankia sp. CiP3]|uniref:glutamate ABC transporter substrate-binding protein n=1 Tax=Frankia sp. CiP3 TaxID=2880971 RepID=UPI001EF52DD1|nr:glutamate ABC transporter substrate-binding protein [Frankia sp. CiP3]
MRRSRGSVGKPAEGRSSGFVGPVVRRFAWARRCIVPLGVGAVALAVATACATVGSPLPTDARPLLPMPTTPAPSSSSPPSCAKFDPFSQAVPRMDPMPTPGGSMPTGSAMADIKQRGFLKVGIAVDDPPLGLVDWRKLQITGFDADVARAVAEAIFGSDGTVQFQPVSIDQREWVLTSGKVDIVVASYTITCERAQHVNFSGVYYTSHLGLLVRNNAGFSSIGDLQGHTVCTSDGSTSFEKLETLPPPAPTVTPAPNIADCLVSLQRGEVDAIATDDVILAGMAAQDPLLTVVPHAFDQAFATNLRVLDEPYGIGIPKSTPDNSQFVAFVNGVLKAYMSDGRWTARYQQWLNMLGNARSPLEEYPPWSW